MSDENPSIITSQTMSDTTAYNSNANIIRMRLDTEPVIKQFQMDILGLEEVNVTEKDGNTRIELVQRTEPLVNEKGARALTSRLRAILNQHNSQGFVDRTEFYSVIAWYIDEIGFDVLVNSDAWEIKPEAEMHICNMMWSAYHLFTTRAIDNLERPSLQNLSTGVRVDGQGQKNNENFLSKLVNK